MRLCMATFGGLRVSDLMALPLMELYEVAEEVADYGKEQRGRTGH